MWNPTVDRTVEWYIALAVRVLDGLVLPKVRKDVLGYVANELCMLGFHGCDEIQ